MGREPSLLPTRRSLVSRLKNLEDQDTWTEFFDIYGKLMYSVARQAGLTHTESEEVVQETVIGVAKKIQNFKYDPALGSFKGWLLWTTRRRIMDQFRKRQRDAARQHQSEPNTRRTATIERIPDPACDIDALYERAWEKALFDAALRRLRGKVNGRHYQIFDLYVVKQWPTEKVAEKLGIPQGQVFVVKCRMSALLQREIERLKKSSF